MVPYIIILVCAGIVLSHPQFMGDYIGKARHRITFRHKIGTRIPVKRISNPEAEGYYLDGELIEVREIRWWGWVDRALKQKLKGKVYIKKGPSY